MDNVISVFYSRKKFMHPEKQPYPHFSFEAEVDYLEEYFTGIIMQYSSVIPVLAQCFLLFEMRNFLTVLM